MLNWIVLNRTDYFHKNGFGVKKPTKVNNAIKPNKPNQTENNNMKRIRK